jgi:nitroreductase
VIELLRTTGAARRFTDEPIAPLVVHQILDDARFAPSGGNRQPWRVAVIVDPALRRQIGDVMQVVWNEYSSRPAGVSPFNVVDDDQPGPPSTPLPHVPNEMLDAIESIPVVLAVAADLRAVALMDGHLERPPITAGASIYPFCWSILLSARSRGLGGVLTTFLSRKEPAAAPALGLPEHHALAATIFLGVPERRSTKLKRRPVEEFATVDRFDGDPFSPTLLPTRT